MTRDEKREALRAKLEWLHPDGWWRRDAVLAALDAAYPAWLGAREIAGIAAAIDPRVTQGWDRRRPNGRDNFVIVRVLLSRLHTQRVVDRIGTGVHDAPQTRHAVIHERGQHPRVKWQRGAGYRYRIRQEARGLL